MKLSNPFKPSRGRRVASRAAVAVAVASAALMVVSGCSGGSGSGGSGGPVTLTYNIWEIPQEPVMKQIIAEFEKENPNIKVNLQVTPWDSYWTKLQTSASSGSAPDVFWMNNSNLPSYASGGVIKPLDDLMKKDGVKASDFVDSAVTSATWDGKMYGMPKDVDSLGLWYNKKLFADAGVAVPTGDWTWDDLIAAAQKLTNKSTGVYGITAENVDQAGWYNTILQAGGDIISKDGKTSGYDSPAAIAGVQFLVDLINKYHVSPTVQQMTDTDAMTMFESGKSAMYFTGSWEASAFKAVPYLLENANVAPLPKDVTVGTVSNSLKNVIFTGTKHPDEAWKFVKFLGSTKAADMQAAGGVVIPATKGTADAWVKSIPQFNLQIFVDELAFATPYPTSLNTSVWQDFAQKEFTKAFTGEESVPDAAHKVADQMNKALAAEK